MDKYKIGDIAKLFNIPMQNLRFYEEKGIVSPEKNEANGYRSYTAWDMNDLLDTFRFRNMGFSLKQIARILKTDDLDTICETYIQQEKTILEEIEKNKIILEALSKERMKIQELKQFVNKLEVCKSPSLLFMRFRKKNSFQDVNENEDLQNLHDELSEWLHRIPEVTAGFYIPLDSLKNHTPANIEYWYGFSIESEKGLRYGMEIETPNEYLASCRSIYTIFEAHEEGTFMEAFYQQVYERIKQEGYVINGSPFGRLIVKAHEKGHYVRYFEAWVPVLE